MFILLSIFRKHTQDDLHAFLDIARTKDLPNQRLLYILRTNQSVLQHTLQLLTDAAEELPAVIINLATDTIIGRVSVPQEYTTNYFAAKHIGYDLNNGKCWHAGTRYDQAVSDFQLDKHRVTSNGLEAVFAKV